MLKIIWYLFLVSIISINLVWLLDNNGTVTVRWLGYELQTDVLTTIVLVILLTLLFSFLFYVIVRILAIKFPGLLRFFFRKSYTKKLEKIIQKNQKAFDIISQIMLALEVKDKEVAEKLHQNLSKILKNNSVNNFLSAKIFLERQNFSKAEELFSKFHDNKHAKILALKSKLKLTIQSEDNSRAITYAKQILTLKKDSIETVRELLGLYKKSGLWQSAKKLINEYGVEKFGDDLQKYDLAVVNSALAYEAFQGKKFLLAIKHAKLALISSKTFLPANEILLKSWIKLGFRFKAVWKIRALWRENPHIVYARIYDFLYRKSPIKTRVKAIKKLFSLNADAGGESFFIANMIFHAGDLKSAKELLIKSIEKQKTYSSYYLLAQIQKRLGEEENFKSTISQAEMLPKNSTYNCISCGNTTIKWSAVCNSCLNYDTIDWNS